MRCSGGTRPRRSRETTWTACATASPGVSRHNTCQRPRRGWRGLAALLACARPAPRARRDCRRLAPRRRAPAHPNRLSVAESDHVRAIVPIATHSGRPPATQSGPHAHRSCAAAFQRQPHAGKLQVEDRPSVVLMRLRSAERRTAKRRPRPSRRSRAEDVARRGDTVLALAPECAGHAHAVGAREYATLSRGARLDSCPAAAHGDLTSLS